MKRSLRSWVRLGLALQLGWSMCYPAQPAWGRAAYPEDELRALETRDESRIRDLRDQEIRQLRIALGRRLASNRRADLYYRLAEIYLEGYRQEYLLEGRVHEHRLESGQADPSIDHSRSRPYLLAGVQASQEILKTGIAFERLDQIYYFLAFNYTELGDRKQGIHYFEELTKRFPNSPFVAEAYRELGDEAYGQNQFRKALGYYEIAARRAAADTMPRILHKLAWSYFRTKQFEQAVDTMKQAISQSQKSQEKFLSLREEALRDMAVFMTEMGRVDEAIAYFQKTIGDKNFYPRILEKLGKQYERNVEPAKATLVYESLLKTNPESEASFRVLVKLVDLDLRRSHFKEALLRLKDLRLPQGGEQETQVAAQNLRAMIRRTATEHHERFRKKGERPALDIAESYYMTYLAVFLAKDDPRKETQEIQMYLAEVKRELGKSREASELYRKVVDSRDSRYAKEAGALWTAALSEAIKKSGDNSKAQEPSVLEKEYVEAADRLQDALGETAEGREAALRAAQVLAGYAETRKDSFKRIQKIIEKSPKTTQALTAARLEVQLQSENPKSDDDDMKELIQSLRKNEALMASDQEIGKGKLRLAISEQETRLKISQISRNEKERNFDAAGKGYEAFALDATQKEIAEKAYANAISIYLKTGDPISVERVGGLWLKRFPKSAKAVESLQGAATQFLIQGHFEQAARLFERTGTDGGDAVSLETSARVFEGIGDMKRSQANRAQFVRLQAPVDRGPTLLALARSYEATQADREAVQAYRECMSVSPELEPECGVRLSELYSRLKDSSESQALLKKVAIGQTSAKRKIDSLSAYVGYARFRLADQQEQSQAFEPLEMPEDRLKKALQQRMAFLESISRAYMGVVDAGGPWAVAALDRLARIALSFADEIDHIAPPAKLSPKGAEQFKKNLMAVSSPLRRKALDTWSDAYRKALSADVLSSVVPEMTDRLTHEKVRIPFRAQGVRGGLRLAGVAADGGSEGAAKAMEKARDRLIRAPQDSQAWVDYGNLLWGEGKPLISRIAYDRAFQLNPKNVSALNNRAVVILNGKDAQEDWQAAGEGQALLVRALHEDDLFVPAKINRALLLNYYRLFERAKPLWEQVLVRNALSDAHDGLGVALQGLGELDKAQESFEKAKALGADSNRFVVLFHQAARASALADGAVKCLDTLGDIKSGSLQGFEKEAVERLKQACTAGRGGK